MPMGWFCLPKTRALQAVQLQNTFDLLLISRVDRCNESIRIVVSHASLRIVSALAFIPSANQRHLSPLLRAQQIMPFIQAL
jgi:hypothetical protein